MNESVRAGDSGPAPSDGAAAGTGVVAGVGAGVAAVTTAAASVPVTRGVDDPVVALIAAFALVSVVAFLASRYSALDRRIAGAVAAASSGAVVVLTGYALNQGLFATVDVPVVSWSPSLLFVAFLSGGIAAGVGVAVAAGVDPAGLGRRGARTIELGLVGLAGLLGPQIAGVLLFLPIIVVVGTIPEVPATALGMVGTAVGMGGITVGYLLWKGLDPSYLDVRLPTLREVGWMVAGVLVIFGTVVAISLVFSTAGVESAEHSTTDQARENPELLFVYVPASILIIGPFEELVYRNVIQKSLYGSFSRAGAVVVGSVIFAIVHTQAYWTAGPGELVASLGIIFGLSLVLGTLYERTENLVVPAIVHGVYNAILFANLYLSFA